MVWTVPTTYTESTVVDKDLLNEQFSNNMTYLFSRPISVVTIPAGGASYTTSSSTFELVDGAFSVSITTYATSNHLLWFTGATRQTSNSYGETMFDIYDVSNAELIGADKYSAPDGLNRMGVRYSNLSYRTQAIEHVYMARPAGTYEYLLYWRDDPDVTGTSELITDCLIQFGVREI